MFFRYSVKLQTLKKPFTVRSTFHSSPLFLEFTGGDKSERDYESYTDCKLEDVKYFITLSFSPAPQVTDCAPGNN